MENSKKIAVSFFEKSRPNAPKNSLDGVIPFSWSNEKELQKGKYKGQKIITLPKRK